MINFLVPTPPPNRDTFSDSDGEFQKWTQNMPSKGKPLLASYFTLIYDFE